MKRTLADIRDNLAWVGCDNETALELCAEVERLHADLDALKETLAGVKSMHADALEKTDRLLRAIESAASSLQCAAVVRSSNDVPPIVKVCDKQALNTLREAAEKARAI